MRRETWSLGLFGVGMLLAAVTPGRNGERSGDRRDLEFGRKEIDLGEYGRRGVRYSYVRRDGGDRMRDAFEDRPGGSVGGTIPPTE